MSQWDLNEQTSKSPANWWNWTQRWNFRTLSENSEPVGKGRDLKVESLSYVKAYSVNHCIYPWIKTEWDGRWSDGSKQWDLVSDAEKERILYKNKNDGGFWMTFQGQARFQDSQFKSRLKLKSIVWTPYSVNGFKANNKIGWMSLRDLRYACCLDASTQSKFKLYQCKTQLQKFTLTPIRELWTENPQIH